MRLIVTIDTEADNQWDHGRPLTRENVRYWPTFQSLCEKHSICPTYLITSEIAGDSRAISFLRPLVETGRAEVGAHLHPWTTPPFSDMPGLTFNDSVHAFPTELPSDLLRTKLQTLTEQITNVFGRRPSSFRAGRFGFNSLCADILSQMGYEVDSSVTPLVSWRNMPSLGDSGGPDFTRCPATPFWITANGERRLLEIPLTILITNHLLQKYPSLLRAYRWVQGKQNGRFLRLNFMAPQPLWLRPFPGVTLKRLMDVWRTAKSQGLQAVVMMFHSSELMPGASHNRPTAASVERLMTLLEQFFMFIRQEGGESVTLTEAARRLAQIPDMEERAL